MDRRGFLKFAAGGTAGLVASPIIWNTLYDAVYWTQNWGWIPRLKKGKNEYLPTVSKLCPSGTGYLVRTVSGVPVRTVGDKNNPVSRGAFTALAASEAELRVSPARIKTPLKRSSDGAYIAIEWEEAEHLLKEGISSAGNAVAAISGDPTSSINEVISAILRSRGSDRFFFMPGDELPAATAWEAMGGQGRIGYDIENSDVILSVGAPILESWGVVASNRAVFNKTHPVGGKGTQKLIYASPVQNNTAAGSDMWVPIKNGTDMAFLLGIANLLIKKGKTTFAPGFQNFAAFASSYTPEKVSALTGVSAKQLEDSATILANAKNPLVIAGSALGCGGMSGPIMTAIAVNLLLGSIGKKGGLVELPYPSPVVNNSDSYRDILKRSLIDYCQSVSSGSTTAPKALVLHSANPLYALPDDSGIKDLISKCPFTVSVASFMSETCAQSDLVLPAALGMEAFDDVLTPYGSGKITYAIARPIAKPFGKARSSGELFIALAQELGITLGVNDMPTLLYKRAFSLGVNFKSMINNGNVHVVNADNQPASTFFYNWQTIQKTASAMLPDAPLQLAPIVILGIGTPQTSIPPFATKIIAPYQLSGKYSVAQMNSATAAKLKISDGEMFRMVASNSQTFMAVASIFEGITPDTVSLIAGLGHTAFDEFSRGKGVNIAKLSCISKEPGTGLPVWGVTGVKAEKA